MKITNYVVIIDNSSVRTVLIVKQQFPLNFFKNQNKLSHPLRLLASTNYVRSRFDEDLNERLAFLSYRLKPPSPNCHAQ